MGKGFLVEKLTGYGRLGQIERDRKLIMSAIGNNGTRDILKF